MYTIIKAYQTAKNMCLLYVDYTSGKKGKVYE